MRTFATALLGAFLCFGCGDDDAAGDSGGSEDASVDAGLRDSGLDGARPDASRFDASGDGGARLAKAALESRSSSTVSGSAVVAIVNGVVTLELAVSGATPGEHGAHIHVKGDCSAVNAASAGDHWNPTSHPHGSGTPDASASSHLGDLGNISVAADGKGVLTISKREWTLGDGSTDDVVGHAIVIHAGQDDLTTQANPDAGITPGNSGARQACGVIIAVK